MTDHDRAVHADVAELLHLWKAVEHVHAPLWVTERWVQTLRHLTALVASPPPNTP
jgi:hypothetical protein